MLKNYGVLCKIFFLVGATLRLTSACLSIYATSIGISSSTLRVGRGTLGHRRGGELAPYGCSLAWARLAPGVGCGRLHSGYGRPCSSTLSERMGRRA